MHGLALAQEDPRCTEFASTAVKAGAPTRLTETATGLVIYDSKGYAYNEEQIHQIRQYLETMGTGKTTTVANIRGVPHQARSQEGTSQDNLQRKNP